MYQEIVIYAIFVTTIAMKTSSALGKRKERKIKEPKILEGPNCAEISLFSTTCDFVKWKNTYERNVILLARTWADDKEVHLKKSILSDHCTVFVVGSFYLDAIYIQKISIHIFFSFEFDLLNFGGVITSWICV